MTYLLDHLVSNLTKAKFGLYLPDRILVIPSLSFLLTPPSLSLSYLFVSSSHTATSTPYFCPHREHNVETRLNNATLKILLKLIYTKAKCQDTRVDSSTCCSISLVNYEEEMVLRILPKYKHLFHMIHDYDYNRLVWYVGRSDHGAKWDAEELGLRGDERVVGHNRADEKEFLLQLKVPYLTDLSRVSGGITEKLPEDQHQGQVVGKGEGTVW
ncbi:hypothetical protein IEQ34_026455 [Dendrobium chrysotoxum]|uniref:Uncharacterized protein n=1 Tax=Dendrobium chrysotoxum TaxID=161865 RepID=A0AAV7FM40_DENCH|nr:hypothetical protein IEQ34_026455 [Dendrobium chrysotoxum]